MVRVLAVIPLATVMVPAAPVPLPIMAALPAVQVVSALPEDQFAVVPVSQVPPPSLPVVLCEGSQVSAAEADGATLPNNNPSRAKTNQALKNFQVKAGCCVLYFIVVYE